LKRSEVKRADKLIDLAGKQGRSKNKKRFIIPLSRQALTLIEKVWDRREDSSDYIFGRADSKRGFSGWSKCKERLDEKLGDMEPWTLHDYRRTFDTLAQDRLKILEHVADACLNHKGIAKAGVKGTYNYAQYIDEKTDALLKWGNYIDGLIHPKPKLRVVS